MRIARGALPLTLLVAGTGCAPPDPITRYEFIVQWMGDDAVEQGPTVCGVARARQHVMALTTAFDLTCRPEDYGGSDDVIAAFSDPPAWIDPLEWDPAREPPPGPLGKVRGYAEWSVGLIVPYGIVVDRFADVDHLERAFEVPLAAGAPLADLEVDGPWAFVADGYADLVVVSLEVFPAPEAVVRVPLGGAVRDVSVDGTVAVALVDNDLVVVDLTDRAAPVARGRLPITGVDVDGVGVRGDHAYLAAEGALYAVDLGDRDAPALVDDAGVASSPGGITLVYGGYLFQAPGFDAPLAVTDLADPAHPRPFWAFAGGNGVFDVAAAGQTLYLATGSGGVQLWGPPADYAGAFDE